jgi:hypothetical protein
VYGGWHPRGAKTFTSKTHEISLAIGASEEPLNNIDIFVGRQAQKSAKIPSALHRLSDLFCPTKIILAIINFYRNLFYLE